MITKKVCMLGGWAVGKTSLVRRFVHTIFSEKYHITIGVKIDKKTVSVGDTEVKLMLWDIGGEEDKFSIPPGYLKGSEGYLLVIDGTRAGSYQQALDIRERVMDTVGDIPFVAVVNKSDLKDEWELTPDILDEMRANGWTVIESSAKLGTGVEEAFAALVSAVLT